MRVTASNGIIAFMGGAGLELLLEIAFGTRVFGENYDSGGVTIETMNDEAEAFEAWFVVGDAFGDGEKTSRLVEYKNIGVFVEDRRESRGWGVWEVNFWLSVWRD